jgi:hypothetical protein
MEACGASQNGLFCDAMYRQKVNGRLVLEDCRLARSELVDGLQGPQWRIRVFMVMALLRASMHALDKVDAVTEPMKSANASVWNERNTDPIFKDFIEMDRNLLLKQYQLRAGQGVTVYMGPSPRSEITYTMNDGPFKGQDPRELVDQAITWIISMRSIDEQGLLGNRWRDPGHL